MKKTIAASGSFLALLLTGSVWISATRFLPDGVPREVAVVTIGGVFVGVFVWLLIRQVRAIMGGTDDVWPTVIATVLNLALLIMAFAWAYQMIGITDNTGLQGEVTHDFMTSVYYSIVTFTTLGYGDFYPRGVGRVLAAMEALTGYLILGILASTAASVLSPRKEPFRDEEWARAARGLRTCPRRPAPAAPRPRSPRGRGCGRR